MMAQRDRFAASEFVSLTVGAFDGAFEGLIQVHDSGNFLLPLFRSSANACIGVQPVENTSSPAVRSIAVFRSLLGSPSMPERLGGTLHVNFFNSATHAVSIDYFEQLPFFLVPLWHTYAVDGNSKISKEVTFSDGHSSPTYFRLKFVLAPGDSVNVRIEVAKKFIATGKFSFSFEKGFDLPSAVVRTGGEGGETFLTRGLVVVVPLPDATATFNMIAITCTALALFYGSVFRAFIGKRSVLVGKDAAAEAERESPLIRLIKWVFGKVVGR